MVGQAQLEGFFADQAASRALFEAVWGVLEGIGPAELRVSESQIAFRCRTAFAWVWMPGRYLRGSTAPLVLTVGLRRRDASPRWKEIVEAAAGRFTHHLELWDISDVDGDVRAWLREAWEGAG
jgi:hypothetical protein